MTTDTPGKRRSGRRKRVLLLLLAGALVLGLLLAGSAFCARRTIGNRALRHVLRGIGAEGLTFHIAEIGPGESRVTDLTIPEDAARIARIEATYSVTGLTQFQLRHVAVEGIDVPVLRNAEGWRVPLLDWISQLRLPAADPSKPPSFVVTLPGATADAVLRLVHHRLGEWRVPLHASAAITPDELAVSGDLEVLGNEQSVSATLDPELSGEIHFTGRLRDLSAVHTLCRFADLPLPLEILPGDTQAELTGTVALDKGRPTSANAELSLRGARVRWQNNEFATGTLRITVRSTSADLGDWEIDGTASGLGGYGVAVSELHFVAEGNQRRGTLRIDPLPFRHDDLTGTLASEVKWDGDRVTATLTMPRLQYDGQTIADVRIEAAGDRQTLAWSLHWQDEATPYGVRSVALAGQAFLTGDPRVTVTGQAIMALDNLATSLGFAGWSGEAAAQVLPGTEVRMTDQGPVWKIRLTAGCPDLAGQLGDLALAGNGLQVDVTGAGTTTSADLTVRGGFLSQSVTQGKVHLQATTGRFEVQATQFRWPDLQALLDQPLGPLPAASTAKLGIALSCESLVTDLAPLAAALGKPGLANGQLDLRLSKATADWTAAGPTFAAEATGNCPDLALAPPGDLRLDLPIGFRAMASGDPQQVTAEVTLHGGTAAGRLGKAEALLADWQAVLSCRRLSLAGLGHAPGTWVLPEGEQADVSLVVGKVSFPLAPWGKQLGLPPTDGEIDLAKTELSVRLDQHGIDAALAATGQGRELALTVAGQVQQVRRADFEVQVQGAPNRLSGGLALALNGAQGRQPGMAGSAETIRLSAACEELDLADFQRLVADPLAFRQADSLAKASLSLGVANAEANLGPGQTIRGITLTGDAIRWTAREGWQTDAGSLRLAIADLALRGIQAKDVTADASLAGTEVQFSLAAPLTGPGVTALVEGQGRLAPSLSFRASVKVPEFPVSTDQGWVLALGGLGGVEFGAKVSAQANARWNPRRLSLGVEVALKDGKVTLPNQAAKVQGIEAALALDLLPTLRSRPRQILRFASAAAGPVTCGPGEIQFRLDGPRLIFVEQAQIGWCGGKLDAYALRFDADQSDIEATVYARELDVGQFVSVFPNMKATGKGKLYGRLPAFRKKGQFGYGDGFLYSIPGEHGRLQLLQMGVLAPALSAMGPTGKTVGDALTDFDYSLFRADIHPSGHAEAGVRLKLVGTKVGDTQPVQLDVNVLGALEEALNLGIRVGGLQKVFEKMEALQRLLGKLVE